MQMEFVFFEVQNDILNINQYCFILYRFKHYLYYSYLHVLTPETSAFRRVVTPAASQEGPHTSGTRDFITSFRKDSHWSLFGAR